MIKKISIICVYAFVAMMVSVSCNDDDIKSFEEVETVQRGYFREVVKPRDVDRLFKSHGMEDFEYYGGRWCAQIGDSLEVFTYFTYDSSEPRVELFKHGKRIKWAGFMFSFMESKKADARLKLDPDKPFFISKSYGRILLQFIYDNHDRYLFCASSDNAGGDYNYWLEKLELFKLNDDGSFYSYSPENNLYYLRWGKVNATIKPECLGDSIMSADRSLYADLDLEKDGEFSFVVRNPATGEKYYQKSLRVTREAMQELRDNGGRVTRKSLNYQEPAGSTSCFQLVLEFPNHHVYKYKLNRVRAVSVIYGNEWLTNDAEIEYQGNSYRLSKNLIDYSNLDCLVLITSNKLPFGMEKSGKFWELSLGLENPEQSWSSLQWRLYDGEEESRIRAFKKYNYKVGQNGGLVLGYSLIFSDDFLPNSDVYYGLIVYDQECPNCLGKKEGGCRLSVDFHKNLATCNECKRVYDLNTYGVIVDGDEGKRLICYRYADMAFDKEIREKAGIIEDGLLIYGNL